MERAVEAYNDNSIASNTNINYVIPSPSKEQIVELKNKSYVSSITPTYIASLPIYKETKMLSNSNLVTIVNLNADLNVTPFAEARLIRGEIGLSDKVILIDYLFAKKII